MDLKNKIYIIKTNNFNDLDNNVFHVNEKEIDFKLLERKNIKIIHRPWFSMMGYTHNIYSINPYTKEGIDASKKGSKTISFEELKKIIEGKY